MTDQEKLRIAVEAGDPIRRRGLLAMMQAAGHQVAPPAEADVLLVDLNPGEQVPGPGDTPLTVLTDDPSLEDDAHLAAVLPRRVSAPVLQAAICAAAAGLIVRLPGGERSFRAAEDRPEPALLTPRELEILAAIGEGLTNKEVARRLGISPHTVKFHLQAIFDKLHAGSRAEAIAKGRRRHLIEL